MGLESIVGLALSAASTVVGMAGQAQQSKAAQQNAQYQQAVAQRNAQQAAFNSKAAQEAGDAQAQTQGLKNAALIGKQRAAIGASGVDVNSGSALDLQTSASELGVLDQSLIRFNAGRTAAGYTNESNNFTAQAGLYGMQGEQAKSAGSIGMVGSLISGAGNFASKWSSYSKTGATPASSTLYE